MLSTMRGPARTIGRRVAWRHASSLRAVHRPALMSALARVDMAQKQRFFSADAGKERLEFKAETRKLLDIVAKSLYTDKEVFVRELISNASDACEKFRFLSATQQLTSIADEDLQIRIKVCADESARTFTIEDTGIGMTREEMVENLGTIAKSGSLEFLQSDAAVQADKTDSIIGQFGVGFYSTFVVAERVEVFTKTGDGSKGDQGWLWESDGSGSFTVTEAPDLQRGTKIVLHLKDDAVEFAKIANVRKAAEKFSSFVDFPIFTVEESEEKEINKQEALWLKKEATDEEHKSFFQYLNGSSYGEPLYSLLYQTDAPMTIKSCFYIPEDAPSRFFSRDPEVGVALHSRRVLVKKQADGVIPKWLHWVKGVVDCEDMPMNISRENMQDSRLMERLSMAVVRKILRFLDQQSKRDAEKYSKFFKNYSYYLKAGLIEDKEGNHGRHRDDLLKLMRFECSTKDKGELISFQEYVDMAKDEQKNVYYFCAPDRATAMSSPFMEQFIQRNRPILLMYDDIDEFVVNSLENFKDKKLVSIDAGDKSFEEDLDKPEDTPDKNGLTAEQQKDVEQFVKDVLKEKVQDIKWSKRLVSSPAVVTSILTPHMRKMMKNMMQGREGGDGMQNVPMTLELSPDHHILTTLNSMKGQNEPVARIAVEQLFDNACIAAGVLDEPRTLLSRLNKVVEMLIYQGAGFDYARNEYNVRPAESEPVTEEKVTADEPKGFVEVEKEAPKESKDGEKKTSSA